MNSDMIYRSDAIEVYRKAKDKSEAHRMLTQLPPAIQKKFSVIDNETGKEADTYEIALNEEWAKHLMYCDMDYFAIMEDGMLILTDECGRIAYCPEGRFTVRWETDGET